MRKILLKSMLTVLLLACLRFVYIKVARVPFWDNVFISTAIGFIVAQIIVEIAFKKYKSIKY